MIIATHYTYNSSDGPGVGETRRFGTKRAAEMWAKDILPTVVTTGACYWRDAGRAESVEMTEQRKGRLPPSQGRCAAGTYRPAGTISAPIRIVPSVGELGWTP